MSFSLVHSRYKLKENEAILAREEHGPLSVMCICTGDIKRSIVFEYVDSASWISRVVWRSVALHRISCEQLWSVGEIESFLDKTPFLIEVAATTEIFSIVHGLRWWWFRKAKSDRIGWSCRCRCEIPVALKVIYRSMRSADQCTWPVSSFRLFFLWSMPFIIVKASNHGSGSWCIRIFYSRISWW